MPSRRATSSAVVVLSDRPVRHDKVDFLNWEFAPKLKKYGDEMVGK